MDNIGTMDNGPESSDAKEEADKPPSNEPPSWGRRILDMFSRRAVDSHQEALPGENDSVPDTLTVAGLASVRTVDVSEVAIPRADIVWVNVEISLDDLVSVFRESRRSRLPVARNTLDDPIGFIHLKDLALTCGFNGEGSAYDLHAMVRKLLFAPPSMLVHELLKMMQAEHIHMALVIDEYGGVDGLVTIEDLVEQAIGDISDEHDVIDAGEWCVEEAPGVFLCAAKAPIDEVEKSMRAEFSDMLDGEDVDTLGGLVCRIAGRVPAKGEIVNLKPNIISEVLEADGRRIKSVRVKLHNSRAA